MTLKYLFFSLIFLAVIFEVVADIFFKKWSSDSKTIFFVLGLVLYLIGTVFWAYSLKHEFLSKAITVFTIFNLITVVLAGVILFDEKLTLINKLGIVFGVVSILLIEL